MSDQVGTVLEQASESQQRPQRLLETVLEQGELPVIKLVIDNLRAAGIVTVVASGNSGATDAIRAPACISSTVSVGATTKRDEVSAFFNSARFLEVDRPPDRRTRLESCLRRLTPRSLTLLRSPTTPDRLRGPAPRPASVTPQ